AARRRSVEQPLRDEDLQRPELTVGPPPDVQAELREQHQMILAEIERLSETLRRTLDVVLQTGSYTEAAASLGCTLAKVKQDVSRARRKLLARLRDKDIVLSTTLAAVLFGPQQADASARLTVAARWLARKWVFWVALTAAGLGTIWLLWAASPGGPGKPPPPARPGGGVAPAVTRETLQEKNLR